MKNLMKDKNLILGVCMAIMALVALQQTQLLPAATRDPLGPAGFPRLLSLILLFLSVLVMIRSLIRKKIDVADFSIRKNSLVVITFVSLAVYVFLLMPRLGFLFSSFIFLWILQYILTPGKKKYITITLISILFPVVVNYIFREFLYVFLPTF